MNFTNTDSPITDLDDDELGFESLAKRISTSIVSSNIDTTDSFTISIEGKWGSGKTSLMNLIKNDIKDKVVVMEFNPWIVNDFEQLVNYFFSELTKELVYQSTWKDGAKKDDIIKDLKKLARTILPDNIKIGTKVLSATYNKPKEKEETVLELKSKINDYLNLKQLKKKIVIIVDDIDRLTDKETETFFRLIKGIADFNNIIYLLLYDKAIVAKSLEQFKQENGEKYLDKIVQYSLSIPKVYNYKLNKILSDKLEILLKSIPKYNFNQDKWNTLLGILNQKITNIRDINKIVSVLSFEYPQIAEEVEFTDFFILSLIKIQKYELYEFIRDRRYVFEYSTHDKMLLNKDERKKEKFENKEKEFYSNLTSFISDFKDLFYILLPSTTDSKYHYTWHSYQIHTYKPLDNHHYFDNYFTFSVADNKFSTQEYIEFSQKLFSNDVIEFENSIVKIKDTNKLLLFLEMFRGIDEEKTIKSISNSKNVILNLLTVHKKIAISTSWYSSPGTTYFNLAKDIFEKIEEPETILNLIYIEPNLILLETKLSFYREIKKVYNFETKFSQEFINKIEKELATRVRLCKLEDLRRGEKNINTISSIYTLISSYKLLKLPVEGLLEEIDSRVFKSRDDFFNILILFKSEVSINNDKPIPSISSRNISEYTNLNIKEIDEYMNKLDEKNFSKEEKEILSAWEVGRVY